MTVIIVYFILLAVHLGVGWALSRYLQRRPAPQPNRPEPDSREVRRVASLISELTTSISDDVREHSSRIDSSTKQLEELIAGGSDAGEIVAVLMPLIESNKKLQSQLDQTKEQLQRQATELDRQMSEARTDALTGLLNRRGFDEEFDRLCNRGGDRADSTYLLLLDVDHFKSVNDTYGHDAGDCVLRETARVLAGTVRETDFPARFGGEEFVVILSQSTLDDARRVAEQIRQAVAANSVRTPSADIDVTVSIGVAGWRQETAESLLKRCDVAMYAAKHAGRNRVYYHDGTQCIAVSSDSHQRLVSAAMTDEVTGLPTYTMFIDGLARRFAEAPVAAGPLTLTVYSIDNLEEIAETYDEHVADLLRRAIGEFLINLSRGVDVVASIGREEFAVLLPGRSRSEARKTAERVRRAAADSPLELPNGVGLPLKLSAGVAGREGDDDPDSLLLRAREAAAGSRPPGQRQTVASV